MQTKNLRVGIIGFGYMGKWHFRRIKQINGLEIAYAFDNSQERLHEASSAGLEVSEDIDHFFSRGMEIVVVATPNHLHRQYCISALKAGCHVICEKPVALNTKELDEVIAISQQTGRLFTVHQNRRWDIDYMIVRETLRSGCLGKPISIESRVHGERGTIFGWRADPESGGGMLYDWGVHLIDQILFLFPERRLTHVFAQLKNVLTQSVDDYLKIELIFDNETTAHVEVGTFSLEKLPRWFIYGDRGTLKIDDFSGISGGCSILMDTCSERQEHDERNIIGPSRMMAPLTTGNIVKNKLFSPHEQPLAFYNNIVSSIRGEDHLYVTPESVRRTSVAIDAAFESSHAKKLIELN